MRNRVREKLRFKGFRDDLKVLPKEIFMHSSKRPCYKISVPLPRIQWGQSRRQRGVRDCYFLLSVYIERLGHHRADYSDATERAIFFEACLAYQLAVLSTVDGEQG
jgi:hypothetical protein